MRPFWCPVTILNTLDHLGKFDGKADEGFFVGYSINRKAFRVFNSRTRIVGETFHVTFLKNKLNVVGSGPTWLFYINTLTKSMNYKPVVTRNQSNSNAGTKENVDAGQAGGGGKKDESKALRKESEVLSVHEQRVNHEKDANAINTNSINTVSQTVNAASIEDDVIDQNIVYGCADDPNIPPLEEIDYSNDDEDVSVEADMTNLDTHILVSPIPTTRLHKDHPLSQIIGDIMSPPQTRRMTRNVTEHEPKKVIQALTEPSWIKAMQDELLQFKLQKVWTLVDLPYGKRAIETKWVFRNKKDERGIMVRNKVRLVTQGYTQEKGIDYDEVFPPVAKIEAIRLFLAYASFKDFVIYQMDVKSAFLYGKIEEEVYVCQPPRFEDPEFTDIVYKVEKALYGLHQAPRAWYETLSTYLLENRFQRGKIDKTLFIKRIKGDILLVQIASIPMETSKPLLKNPEAEDVDVHLYRSMIGSLMYLIASRANIIFVVCACVRFQVTPKVSHLHAVKRIFRYLKGQPKLGFWYPKDSPFDLKAYSDSDYVGASLDRKSTTGDLTPPFNDEYDTPSHTKKVFANMRMQGKDFSRTITPLFPSMLAPQALESEGSRQPTKPQHTPNTASPSHIEPIPNSSGPTTIVADETIYEERGDSIERASTTAASLDAKQDSSGPRRQETILGGAAVQTRFETTSKQSNDPPLSRVNTLRSGEDSMKLKELVELCTQLSIRVLALENIKTAQNLEITNLKKGVKKLEKKKKSRTPQLKRRLFKVRIKSSTEKSLGAQEDASNQGRNIVEFDQDEGISFVPENVETQGRYGYDLEVNIASTSITTVNINITIVEPVTTASAPVATVGVSVSTAEPNESEKSKEKSKEKGVTKGVTIQEPSEAAIRQTMSPLLIDPKDIGKAKMIETKKPKEEEANVAFIEEWDNMQAMMDADYELCARLQAEEQGELTIEERSKLFVELMDKRKKHFAKLRVEEIRRKPPTKPQKRNQMCTYLKNMVGFTHNQLKNKSFEEIQKAFDKTMSWINSFVPMDSEVVEGSGKKAKSSGKEAISKKRAGEKLDEESVKRQKVEDDAEKAELKTCLEIVPKDDEAVNVESLATKYLIVDWKTQILKEDKKYYKIIKANGSTKYYKIFNAMLDDFDTQDVLDLYRLVKERFKITSPEGYDILLWGDLITLFELSEEDEIWKDQQDYTLISWRLHDSCGVHLLLMDTGICIHVLIEKKYPLTQEILTKMLSRRLEVDHESEMAFELLRFTRSHVKK
ncbi:putative ribonuclease H-like domain-containing protein [Tanacetum coccineum]